MVLSTLLQNCVVLFLSPQNRMVLSSLHQSCLILSLLLQNLVVLSFPSSEPRGPLSIYLLQNLMVLPFPSELRGLLFLLLQNHMALFLSPQNLVVLSIYIRAVWSTLFDLRAAWYTHLYGCRA